MFAVLGEGGAGRAVLTVDARDERGAVRVARREDWGRSDVYRVLGGYPSPRGTRAGLVGTTSGGGEASFADEALALAVVGDLRERRYRAEAERRGWVDGGLLTEAGRTAARLRFAVTI